MPAAAVTARRRHRLAHRRAALAALAGGLALVAACSSGGSGPDGGSTAAGAGTPAAEAADTTAPADTSGPYAVGHRVMTLVDHSRTTPAVAAQGLPERPDRTLDVEVYYPAGGDATAGGDVVDATGAITAGDDAEPAAGTFPLVVFVHGFDGEGSFFRAFGESWARHGYVVALPTFPLSRHGIADSNDVVNQPGDISFVADELGSLDRGDPLAGHVDADTLAVGGHSLGSATVFGVGYNSCCVDDRIDAVIAVSGGPYPFPAGNYDDPPATPMLLVHGGADETVATGISDLVFGRPYGPVWYLRPGAATHAGVFFGEPGRLFDEAAVAFLDAELKGDPAGLDAVGADVTASGVAEWRVAA
jgi:dienelactone hydrolase